MSLIAHFLDYCDLVEFLRALLITFIDELQEVRNKIKIIKKYFFIVGMGGFEPPTTIV